MDGPEIIVSFAPELHVFVTAARRAAEGARVRTDGASTLGHLVESLGVPLTEVGRLSDSLLSGSAAELTPGYVPAAGDRIRVEAVVRPQTLPGPARFLLDVHLGTLARRLRLLGVDAAYERTDIGDAALAAQSAREERVMLSRDRGLLHRRELWAGAYVYSHRPEEQLDDVLERFAPPLAPWTRCVACNGELRAASVDEVRSQLRPGTERSYDTFSRCTGCGRAYWRGAHQDALNDIVEDALRRAGVTGSERG
ncbi:uncharacterized protein with PIN domain [Streptacidiphilus sp. MAP12-20]|uniref:Mut7-C RNAse domain-containing protein n=1 Tax=Streptacidiphilus sp. MAP12-20 TaxID=3156299 RepID=UPI003519886B